MTILDIITEVADEPSKNKKIEILQSHKDNKLLKQVFVAALDPNINYWIKKIPAYDSNVSGISLENALDMLSDLSNRNKTGQAGIDHLKDILTSLAKDDAEIIARIIQRDMKMGASTSTVNKIWKNLVPETKVMLADAFNNKTREKIKYPVTIEDKEDGMRCFVVVDGDGVDFFSRSGKRIETLGNLKEEFIVLNKNSEKTMYDGELLVRDEKGKILDRKTGNGILNKAVKGTINQEEADRIVIRLWDMVPYDKFIEGKYSVSAIGRKIKLTTEFQLGDVQHMAGSKLSILAQTQINSEEELLKHYEQALLDGKEGLIVKNPDGIWVNKRSKDWLKMKDGMEGFEKEIDLRVIEWIEGNGKYKGMLGALMCQTDDGRIVVKVGGGFSDIERKTIGLDIVGKIITAKYGEEISSRNKDTNSLFLPRFVEIREDRDDTN